MACATAISSLRFINIVLLLVTSIVAAFAAGNFNQNVDVTWGDGRGKILNNGQLLSLSLDKGSGSGFRSKNEFLFGKIDMQLKLVPGNSAGTVTTQIVKQCEYTRAFGTRKTGQLKVAESRQTGQRLHLQLSSGTSMPMHVF